MKSNTCVHEIGTITKSTSLTRFWYEHASHFIHASVVQSEVKGCMIISLGDSNPWYMTSALRLPTRTHVCQNLLSHTEVKAPATSVDGCNAIYGVFEVTSTRQPPLHKQSHYIDVAFALAAQKPQLVLSCWFKAGGVSLISLAACQ